MSSIGFVHWANYLVIFIVLVKLIHPLTHGLRVVILKDFVMVSRLSSKLRRDILSAKQSTQEWLMLPDEVKDWRHKLSSLHIYYRDEDGFIKSLQRYTQDKGVYIGPNTFSSGLILVVHVACERGRVHIVRYFIDNHIAHFDINQLILHHPSAHKYYPPSSLRRMSDVTPFDRVQHSKNALLHVACESGSKKIVDLLLANNAIVDPIDCCGKTPFLIAVEKYHTKLVTTLLKAGANIHHQDKEGKNALIYAISSNKHQSDLLDVLIKHGVDPNVGDKYGCSLLHNAVNRTTTLDAEAVNGVLKAGISPLISCSKLVPTALFYCHPLINSNAAYIIMTHSDCPESHKIDYTLIRACSKLHTYVQSANNSDIESCIALFETALKSRDASNMPPLHEPVKAYGNFLEVLSFEEFRDKYLTVDSSDLSIYTDHEIHSRLVLQCLTILERCLGYGNSVMVTYLIQYGEWFYKVPKNLPQALSLWSRAVEMLYSAIQARRMSATSFASCVNLAIRTCYNVPFYKDVLPFISLPLELHQNLFTIWSDLIECLRLLVLICKTEEHSHYLHKMEDRDRPCILYTLYQLFSNTIDTVDFAQLGKELIQKCPIINGRLGWPANIINAYLDVRALDISSSDVFDVESKFLIQLMEWGGSAHVNDITIDGQRILQQCSHLPKVVEILQSYGAHDDAIDARGDCFHSDDSPLSLYCLSARAIVKEGISYQDLPSHIVKFISFHDPIEVEVWLNEHLYPL